MGNKLKPYVRTLGVHKYEICAILNLKIRPFTTEKYETDEIFPFFLLAAFGGDLNCVYSNLGGEIVIQP